MALGTSAWLGTSGSVVEEGRINSLSVDASIPCDSMAARTRSRNASAAALLLIAAVSCSESKIIAIMLAIGTCNRRSGGFLLRSRCSERMRVLLQQSPCAESARCAHDAVPFRKPFPPYVP